MEKHILYNESLNAYFEKWFWGMPTFTPLKKRAYQFKSIDEAKKFAWQRATSGNMIIKTIEI